MTDLTSLVEAVAADVWAQQKDWPWDVQDPAVKHAAREAVLPFVAATVKHMTGPLAALSWEMCPQDGKRLRDALGESDA